MVGPICESSDIFGRGRKLPASTAPDDVVVISDAGAYGYSMSSHYNNRGLPAQDILDDAS